jgi:GNAT superfamily N-acetyltransferase
MFTSAALAAQIDRAEGRLCAGIADVAVRTDPASGSTVFAIGGGVAVFAGSGSPTNKMIGVGFDGLPSDGELDAVEALFRDRGAPLQAEVSTLADPAFHAQLITRGYEPHGFENILGCPLAELNFGVPGNITIDPVVPEVRAAWVEVLVDAFAAPDVGGVGGDALPPSDFLRHWLTLTMQVPGFECLAASMDGAVAGGGALRLDGDIAQFCGAGTLPAFRRRGVQTALLRWRLGYARSRGCQVAVVSTQPASKSQQNVQREGFALLYARQLLLKAPPPP